MIIMSETSRRKFLSQVAGATAFGVFYNACSSQKKASSSSPRTLAGFFEISLAEWSLHKALFANKMTNLDFPVVAKQQYGISAVEYVNQFFKDKAKDTNYLNEFGEGSAEDVQKAAVESLSSLGEYAAKENINVTVENHGGYSSNGQWLAT